MWTPDGPYHSDKLTDRVVASLRTTFKNKQIIATYSNAESSEELTSSAVSQVSCPAVLVGLGYLTDADDRRWLRSTATHMGVAKALAEGVVLFGRKQKA